MTDLLYFLYGQNLWKIFVCFVLIVSSICSLLITCTFWNCLRWGILSWRLRKVNLICNSWDRLLWKVVTFLIAMTYAFSFCSKWETLCCWTTTTNLMYVQQVESLWEVLKNFLKVIYTFYDLNGSLVCWWSFTTNLIWKSLKGILGKITASPLAMACSFSYCFNLRPLNRWSHAANWIC